MPPSWDFGASLNCQGLPLPSGFWTPPPHGNPPGVEHLLSHKCNAENVFPAAAEEVQAAKHSNHALLYYHLHPTLLPGGSGVCNFLC